MGFYEGSSPDDGAENAQTDKKKEDFRQHLRQLTEQQPQAAYQFLRSLLRPDDEG